MKIVLFGSSLVSAYWNGAATYYRGMCKALHARGHHLVFVEPDLYERQAHRDLLEDPPYADVRVCRDWSDLQLELDAFADADLVAKCSGVGGWDMELAQPCSICGVREHALPSGTSTRRRRSPPLSPRSTDSPDTFRALIPQYDLILLYGGGPPGRGSLRPARRAPDARLVYNAVDPDEYFPVQPEPDKACDLLFMGNRMPDREQRVHDLFFRAAELSPRRVLRAGWQWLGRRAIAAQRALDRPRADRRPPRVELLGALRAQYQSC